MPFFTWGDQYMVHIAEIDSQHKRLFDMVNEMHDAVHSGKGKEVVGKILRELTDYATTHFALEEELLARLDYPEYRKHKAEYDKLLRTALDLFYDYQSGRPVLPPELMRFLKNWLASHILGTDKRYTAFLHSKGVK